MLLQQAPATSCTFYSLPAAQSFKMFTRVWMLCHLPCSNINKIRERAVVVVVSVVVVAAGTCAPIKKENRNINQPINILWSVSLCVPCSACLPACLPGAWDTRQQVEDTRATRGCPVPNWRVGRGRGKADCLAGLNKRLPFVYHKFVNRRCRV